MTTKDLYSSAEVAHILHLSRVEVFRRIKSGRINAQKIGRNYVITRDSLTEALEKTLGVHRKQEIEKAIDKALDEYKEVFIKLGKE
jgi:excisionase family DNA binding protein